MSLETRENEVIEILKKIQNKDFVLIGGYATNVYVQPRFSVDCDIVVKNKSDAKEIAAILRDSGYAKREQSRIHYGNFMSFEKNLNGIKATFDILVGEVLDRQTGISYSADWIFTNSDKGTFQARTIIERLEVRVISPEALFVLKLTSARTSDIRDLFMLIEKIDFDKVAKQIKDEKLIRNYQKFAAITKDKRFVDNLQGVFGKVDWKQITKNRRLIAKLGRMIKE